MSIRIKFLKFKTSVIVTTGVLHPSCMNKGKLSFQTKAQTARTWSPECVSAVGLHAGGRNGSRSADRTLALTKKQLDFSLRSCIIRDFNP